jgi:hypothetical protein
LYMHSETLQWPSEPVERQTQSLTRDSEVAPSTK